MRRLFTKDDDGSDEAYYGVLNVPDKGELGIRGARLRTPYFRYKIDCESYTRRLAAANKLKYSYTGNIWYHEGHWTKPNESFRPKGEDDEMEEFGESDWVGMGKS